MSSICPRISDFGLNRPNPGLALGTAHGKIAGVKTLLRSFPLLLICLTLHARGQALDPFVSSPDLWRTPRADFVDQHRDLGFYWLSSTQDRAETHSKGLTLFSGTVCEVDAEFQADKLSGVTLSIYNRGDAGEIGRDQMTGLVQHCVEQLTAMTKVQPAPRSKDASDAVKAWAFAWQTPASKYLLEYSFVKEVKSRNIPFRAEFVRLKVSPAEQPKNFMAASMASATPAVVFKGPAHVKKDPGGDVRIDSVPMVDQGRKGYCVVATTERVMRYYGIPVDEHELAELANSSATEGTNNEAMFDSLKKLSQHLHIKIQTIDNMDSRQFLDLAKEYNLRTHHGKLAPELPISSDSFSDTYSAMQPGMLRQVRTRNKAELDRFKHIIQDHITQGIPVLWTIMYGIIPEENGPKAIGGHMRLIIGFNTASDEILYSDSWGPGHELKRMPAGDAYSMTLGLNAIEPL